MRYCVSGRHAPSVLREADEIKMKYDDIERVIDYIKDYPDKTIIIEIPKGLLDIDWKLLETYGKTATVILCLYDLRYIADCIKHGLQYYWAYPITTYYELNGILDLHPHSIVLGAPLSFDLEAIHNMTNAYIRLVANVAYQPYIPRKDGICGQYIRPEDIKHYAPYVNTIEFGDVDLTAEKTLLTVYKTDKNWPGNLNLLIKNLNYNIDNRAIPEEFGAMRVRCGQRCMKNGTCHYCMNAFKFSTALRTKHYEMQKQENN